MRRKSGISRSFDRVVDRNQKRRINTRQLRRWCIYCGHGKETKDHVPARSILVSPYRNLLTVPACYKCNQAYKLDEEYFACALATAGWTETLMERVQPGGSVHRACSERQGLNALIQSSLIRVGDEQFLIPKHNRIAAVLNKVAAGLCFVEFQKPLLLPSMRLVDAIHARDPDFVAKLDNAIPQPPAVIAGWPEVGSRAFAKTVLDIERGVPLRLDRLVGILTDGWKVIQKDVFRYRFFRLSDPNRLLCLMNFHETLLGIVDCGPVRGLRPRRSVPASSQLRFPGF